MARIRIGKRTAFFCALGLLLLTFTAGAESFSNRMARIEEQITQTQAMLNEATNDVERTEWKQRLDLLQQDRENLRQRHALDEKEQKLAVQQRRSNITRLRESIRAVDTGLTEPSQVAAQLDHNIRELRSDHADLEQNRVAISGPEGTNTTEEYAEIDQHLRALDEEIQARAQEREAVDARMRLINEAVSAEDLLKTLPINPRPALKLLREKHRLIETKQKLILDTDDVIKLNQQRHDEVTAAIVLTQEKVAHMDDELALLNKKTTGVKGWLSARPMYYSANMEKKYLSQRLQSQQQQLTAIASCIQLNTQLRDLLDRERAVLQDDFSALLTRFELRLMFPVCSLIALLLGYLIFTRLLLPFFFSKHQYIVARRLAAYLSSFLAVVVLTVFFFEDLKSVATILGIASAAVVIALQDLCSAFAGWFVIMSSHKLAVGHRVEIDDQRGDIIDIQLLRTTLLEINNWLGVDEPTGRILVIPNNFVFKSKVFNYNYLHPFIWNKLDITVTYETPAQEAQDLLRRILEEETRENFATASQGSRSMETVYGVPDANYQPKIYSFLADSGVMFRLVFVAHYKSCSSTRNRINERIIREFAKDPRMQLAYPTTRQIFSPENEPPRQKA